MARTQTTEICPVAGCTRPKGHSGRHTGQPKGTYDRNGPKRRKTASKPATSAGGEDAVLIAAAAKVVEVCGALGVEVKTVPHEKGVAFITADGRAAVMTAEGAVKPARLEVE